MYKEQVAAKSELKELPISFIGRGEVKSFNYHQVKRSNKAYIYEVCDTFGNTWYEVFKRIIDTRFNKIAYPKSKSFRISAWTSTNLMNAEQQYKIINISVTDVECIEYYKASSTGEYSLNSGFDVHLEHIIPQTINTKVSKKEFGDWELYLSNNALARHKKSVNKIGNMTLLAGSLNIGASNNPF